MSVFIYEPDAFEKMVKIEGEDYRRCKNKESFDDCSFDAFLEAWEESLKRQPDFKDFRPEFGIGVKGNQAIYGWWGWNRYVVLNSGEIMFHSGFLTSVAGEEIVHERVRYFRRGNIERGLNKMLQ
jgi:hypothetical protein